MLRIYCDTGAYCKELAALERDGHVEVVQFRHHKVNQKIRRVATPPRPRSKQTQYSWAELNGVSWAEMASQSEKWPALLKLVGDANRTAAQHLDAAFMSDCSAFLTTDEGDIARHRAEIEALLGLKVFHYPADWNALLSFIAAGG